MNDPNRQTELLTQKPDQKAIETATEANATVTRSKSKRDKSKTSGSTKERKSQKKRDNQT